MSTFPGKGDNFKTVAVVKSGTTYTVYLDGVEDASGTTANVPASGAGYIGADNGTANWAGGTISDVRVYDSALSESAIATIHGAASNAAYLAGGATPPESHLIYGETFAPGPTITDGDGVDRWNDLTDNDHDFVQTSVSLRPTYDSDGIGGKPALLFNGTSQFLEAIEGAFLSGSAGTVIAVVRFGSVSSNPTVFSSADSNASNQYNIARITGSPAKIATVQAAGGQNDIRGDTELSTGTDYILVWSSDGSAYHFYVNGNDETESIGTGSIPAATQVHKTSNLILAMALYFAEFRPGPGMIVVPDELEAKKIRDRIYAIVQESQKFTALGGTVIAAGLVLSGLATIVTTVGAAIGLLLTPIGAVTALVVGGVAAWALYTDSGREAVNVIRGVLGDLAQTAQDTFGGISDALASGDLRLAAEIAWAGIRLAWAQGTQHIKKLWLDAKFFALETWESVKVSIAEFFVEAFATVESAWVKTVGFIESTWSTLVSTLSRFWRGAQLGFGTAVIQSLKGIGLVSQKQASEFQKNLQANLGGSIKDQQERDRKRQAEIDSRTQRKLKGIEETRQGSVAILEKDRAKAIAGLSSDQGKERLAAARALVEAENKLQGLRKQAAANRPTAKEEEEKAAVATATEEVAKAGKGNSALITVSAAAAEAAGFSGGASANEPSWAKRQRDETVAIRRLTKEMVLAQRMTADELARLTQGMQYA